MASCVTSHVDEAQAGLSRSFFIFTEEQHGRLSALRRSIHAHPELSNKECNTTNTLVSFLQSLKNPPEIVSDIGGGFLALFNFTKNGATIATATSKTVVFRCELDAVPVDEKNDFIHKSNDCGVAHKCGHDGHMAIISGLALLLSDFYSPSNGQVALLFQPAEETGEGAQQMVDSPNPILRGILESRKTTIFALHNVPGFPKSSIVLPRGNSFASASKGMHIKLTGTTSHASQPHLGKNPTMAMCNIIQGLLALPSMHIPYDQKALVTIVGARAGERAFGVSAGDAEVLATLRATTDTSLRVLEQKGAKLVNGIASTYDLSPSIHFEDSFAATINDPISVALVQKVSSACGLDVFWMDEAFPWSEDFGVFLQRTKGAMFGLGMGEAHEPLHGEFYDFDDSAISNGVNIFASILRQVLDGNQEWK